MLETPLTDAVSFAVNMLGFNPDPMQRLILDANIWRGILNCTRQWGKSTIMAIKALHEALFLSPRTTILVLCPTKHQAGELLQVIRDFCIDLGIRPRGDGNNSKAILLPNGSRIIGISNRSRIRGYRKVSLLLVDEAAEVTDSAYNVIRPALATTGAFGGKIWLMSTPQGTAGLFFQTWTAGGPRWTRFRAAAEECPRISKAFLAEERENLGERLFAQEYMCEFIQPPDCLLNREDIYAAIRGDVPAMWN